MSEERCVVCALPLDGNHAVCNRCGHEFHLALRIDAPIADCGDAWIDEEVQALVFGCNICLGRGVAGQSPRHYQRRTGVRANAIARARRRNTV